MKKSESAERRAERLAAEWGLLKIDYEHCQRAVRAARRYCQCLAEFEDPRYCSEWLEALEAALEKVPMEG